MKTPVRFLLGALITALLVWGGVSLRGYLSYFSITFPTIRQLWVHKTLFPLVLDFIAFAPCVLLIALVLRLLLKSHSALSASAGLAGFILLWGGSLLLLSPELWAPALRLGAGFALWFVLGIPIAVLALSLWRSNQRLERP